MTAAAAAKNATAPVPWWRSATSRRSIRRRRGAQRPLDRLSRGTAHLAARAFGLRQDHPAQDHRRAHSGNGRRGQGRRPRGDRAGAGTGFRLPGFRADAVGDRDAQCRLRPRAERHGAQRTRGGGGKIYRQRRPQGLRERLSARTVGRHAPARRAGPGARRQCQGAADGRALLGGRRADAAQVPGRPARTHRQGAKTFLFVTHSIEEAVYVSDRIIILSRRPSQVSSIVEPDIVRGGGPDQIRRDSAYLDTVESIWQSLKRYLD